MITDEGNEVTGVKTITRVYRNKTTGQYHANIEVKMQSRPNNVCRNYGCVPLKDVPDLLKRLYKAYELHRSSQKIYDLEYKIDTLTRQQNLLRDQIDGLRTEQLHLKARQMEIKYEGGQ